MIRVAPRTGNGAGPEHTHHVVGCRLTVSKPVLKAPMPQRLKLQYDEVLSNFAFNFNLRRYNVAGCARREARRGAGGGHRGAGRGAGRTARAVGQDGAGGGGHLRRGAGGRPPRRGAGGTGLHSSTFQLYLSRF
jgi:hypothetical protein